MKLKFYYRQECHLCEDMLELIRNYISEYQIELKMIDIDSDSKACEKYTLLIPVLTDHLDQEICHYFFDKIRFEQFLNKLSS